MPPMSRDQSMDHIVDADVVQDVDGPAPASERVEGPAPAGQRVEGAATTAEQVEGPGPVSEQVEGVPVLAEVRTISTPSAAMLPAVQAAAVAATGFVAGVATLALVKRHSARKLARSRQSRRALDTLPIVGSRSFLVDVHLIARDPGGNQ
ncbi:MAG TPA: hypothetical protein VE571_09005 [Solirubrobacteraceae bacterium]|jgi:hypothetical protein|nr:hypothetical protein [Solirubrobacteraceae bacterium]